jgi:hypothetical protein
MKIPLIQFVSRADRVENTGCPIQWRSKLQTNISTSTMEAEHTALSIALRAAIPLWDVGRRSTSDTIIKNGEDSYPRRN